MFRKIALIVFLGLTALAVVVALKSDREVTTTSQEAYEHYLAGTEYFEKFYIRDAIEELQKAVALDSNFAMAQGELAMAYYSRGFVKKGEEMQEQALLSRPFVSNREQMILDIWEQQWRGNADSAYVLAKRLYEEYPENLDAVAMMGALEYGHNNWEQALQYYQKALEIQPDYAPAYNMAGYLNFFLGRYDDALTMLDKYLEYAKDQANPHDSRGEILHATGRYKDAIDAFRQAYNINPEFDFAITHMAASYNELGQMSQVDYAYEILLRGAPNERRRLEYLTDFARSMVYRGDLDSAITLCKYVIENDPELDEGGVTLAPYMLGMIYYKMRDAENMKAVWDSARVILANAEESRPESKGSSSHKRWRLIMDATEADLAGDLDKAESLFAEAIETVSRPNDKFYYRMYYADVLMHNDKHDLAISELQKNLSINPNHALSLISLADIYENRGDKASARAYREKALEVWSDADPGFKPAQELREKLDRAVTAMKEEPKTASQKAN